MPDPTLTILHVYLHTDPLPVPELGGPEDRDHNRRVSGSECVRLEPGLVAARQLREGPARPERICVHHYRSLLVADFSCGGSRKRQKQPPHFFSGSRRLKPERLITGEYR
ncbi:uncharacterized protein V6R79_016504 [Siganus canaliculatus]